MKVFDCIICGSGISGSYLAYSLSKASIKHVRSILLLDNRSLREKQRSMKNISFWSKDTVPFGESAEKTWNKLSLHNVKSSLTVELKSYRYFSFTEGNLQKRIWEVLKDNRNLFFKNEHIVSICEENNIGCVKTDKYTYYGKYIFDSVTVPTSNSIKTSMQGKSWRISFAKPVFDSSTVTFMDFRTLDTNELMFFYVLPISKTRAVIELAHFVHNTAIKQDYERLLHRYLSFVYQENNYTCRENIGTKCSYSMFLPKRRYKGNVIRIGRAAGLVKPTSGFGVIRIYKDIDKLVYALKNDLPIPRVSSGIPYWLSDMCMMYMTSHKVVGSSFFISLFEKYSADTILSFLNEEASREDLSQLISVPASLFLQVITSASRSVFSRTF